MARIFNEDARRIADLLEPESVQCCVTSPPYFGLRDYGVEGQIGLEGDIEAYVQALVDVFRGVWKVLRPDGTLWLNLGDSYNGSGGAGGDYGPGGLKEGQPRYPGRRVKGIKYRLRSDLTDEQVAYVLTELSKARRIRSETQEGLS